MKTMKACWMLLAGIMCAGLVSCTKEEQTWEEWEVRNALTTGTRRIQTVKLLSGEWVNAFEQGIIWFEMDFSKEDSTFRSTKFYYTNGVADESTKEVFTAVDKTNYTINGKVVECTVGGEPYCRIIISELGYMIRCQINFYREYVSYECTF